MKAIDVNAIVSCYADSAALLVMLLLLLLSERLHRRKNLPMQIFRLLSITLTVTCVLSFICHAMYRQPAPWCHYLAVMSRTLWEWFAFLIILFWIGYVEIKMHRTANFRSFAFLAYNIPFWLYTVLLIVNLFTGIIFVYTADNQFEPRRLYYVFMVIEAVYFLWSVIRARLNDDKTEKARFIHVGPMILPVVLGVGAQFFFPYQLDVLGFAVGVALLYLSMASELRLLDEESGLYNRGFLTFLFDLALAGEKDPRSALILESEGNLQAGFDILQNTLHQTGDVIRVEEQKYLMFSETDSRSELQLLSTHVEEAVEKYNAAHPEEKIRMTVHCRMRTEAEDSFKFLRAVVEDKDAGDPVRGVVSMISELDRLDKELALAADIQINTLPMNFPPFPERTEFDLYASMRPAKEVGGDFYDFFLIDSDHLALVIADVSGKGIPAALFMMISKTLIKNQLMSGCDPAEALEHVNTQLCERNSSMMFVTVWVGVLEISTGKGMACNAGHENPAVRRCGGDFELLRYRHGILAGVNKDAKYQNREFELHPGDCIFVYTDGVPEANNSAEEMFGEQRMTATLNQNSDADPEELIHRMHNALDQFAGGAAQFDDITMLCLKYNGLVARSTEI